MTNKWTEENPYGGQPQIPEREHTDDYVEEESLIAEQEYVDDYDEEESLIADHEYLIEDYANTPIDLTFEKTYVEDPGFDEFVDDLLARYEKIAEDFVDDTIDYYKMMGIAQLKWAQLKVEALITSQVDKYVIEVPTMYINNILYGGTDAATEEEAKWTSSRYDDDNPYLGEARKSEEIITMVADVRMSRFHKTDETNKFVRRREYNPSDARKNLNEDAFAFSIRNLAMVNSEFGIEHFPAYISNLNESIGASWNSTSFINRSEAVYVYNNTDRSVNFDFTILATKYDVRDNITPDKFKVYTTNDSATLDVVGKKDMWRKMNFLQGLTKPKYDANGKFIASPFCRLNIGDIYINQLVIFESLNFSYEPLVWDLTDGDIKPMIIKVSAALKILHEDVPSVDGIYYGKI